MRVSVHDARRCALGEGPFWHPERHQAFWFDILGKRMLGNAGQTWQFDEHVSAAGWIDADRLLIASETALFEFDLTGGTVGRRWPLDDDNPLTRSNDGRADLQGGFWIGTMAKTSPHRGRGAIYRFHRGEIRCLHDRVAIPNAICFAPDGRTAYFADTGAQLIWRQGLDAEGWPAEERQVFADLRRDRLSPDGAVVDSEGNLWNARWGVGQVACHAPDGSVRRVIDLPAMQTTCPCFIGAARDRMIVTSAAEGLPDDGVQGLTWLIEDIGATGQPEHRVILD